MPLADHYNLEIFFQDGKQSLGDSKDFEIKYDFKHKFPKIQTNADLHNAVVEQMFHLADALLFLHDGLGGFEMHNSYLAHMDLKPENILIHGDPQDNETPAGQWIITDFGISAFHKESHEPIQEIPTIRDVTSRLTSLSGVVRGRGPYQPPEIGLQREKAELGWRPHVRQKLDFRQCDVWSFGCVLSDVLAFALNRSRGIQDVREARTQEGNDYFYKFVEPVREIDEISASNTKLKESFVDWGKQIRERNHGTWVCGYLDILFKQCLVTHPADRGRPLRAFDLEGLERRAIEEIPLAGIRSIKTSLGKLSPRLRDEPVMQQTSQSLPGRIEGSSDEQILDSPNVPTQSEIQSSSCSSMHGPVNSVMTKRPSPVNGGAEGVRSQNSQDYVADFQQRQSLDGRSPNTITTVPLNSDAAVIAVAMESTGERIAILCKAEFSVFATRSPESLDQTSMNIPTEVKWNNIRIAHPWLAIFGAKSSGTMVVSNATLQLSSPSF